MLLYSYIALNCCFKPAFILNYLGVTLLFSFFDVLLVILIPSSCLNSILFEALL